MKPEAFNTPQFDRAPEQARHRQTLLIAGASGLIGTAFTEAARTQGHTVRHLVRRNPQHEHEYRWDPNAHAIDATAVQGVDTIVNLSGASISKMPWTKRYKAELRSSRLNATDTLVTAMRDTDAPPKRLLSGSAIGVYGDGFLATLCDEWEQAARAAESRTEVTLLRTGLVLSDKGGILPVVSRIAKLGAAGRLGDGTQRWSWISLDDYVAAVLHLIQSPLSGPVNMTAPNYTTAAQFMRTLAEVLHRPYLLPAPRFALRTLLGEAAEELLLADQPALPTQLLADGFVFRDIDLRATLQRLLTSGS